MFFNLRDAVKAYEKREKMVELQKPS
jgi:hypothetical protein